MAIARPKTVEKFFEDYTLAMNKVYTSNVVNLQKKVWKKGKSKSIPSDIRKLATSVRNINIRYLGFDDIKKLEVVLGDIYQGTTGVSSKNYSPVNTDKAYKDLEKIRKISEKNQEIAEEEAIEATEEEIQEKADKKLAKAEARRAAMEQTVKQNAKAFRKYLSTNKELTDSQKESVRRLSKVNPEGATDLELRDYIRYSDNILENDNFAGSYKIASAFHMKQKVAEFLNYMDKKGVDVSQRFKLKGFREFQTQAVNFKAIFGDPATVAKLDAWSGQNLFNQGLTKVKKEMDIQNKKFDAIVKNIINTKNSDIRSAENNVFRGIAGQLIQGDTEEDFNRNKRRMEQHFTNSSSKENPLDKKIIALQRKVYDELKGLDDQQAVLDYVKDKNDGNFEMFNLWMDTFGDIKEDLRLNTEEVYDQQMVDNVENYLPIKIRLATGLVDEDVDQPMSNSGGIPNPKRAGASISRVKTNVLPKHAELDLDFDAAMFDRLKRVLFDIETSKAVTDMKNFFGRTALREGIGEENFDQVNKTISDGIKVGLNLSVSSAGDIERGLQKLTSALAKIGRAQALAGVFQYPKQFIGAAGFTMTRLGSNAGFFIEGLAADKSQIPILDMFTIGTRGEEKVGYRFRGDKPSEYEENQTFNKITKAFKDAGVVGDKIEGVVYYGLRKGDAHVGHASWLAHMKDYLVREGGLDPNDIDFSTLHERLDQDLYKEAASHAENMVDLAMNPSADYKGSKFYQDSNVWKNILVSMALPFYTVTLNMKVRMATDYRNIIHAKRTGNKALLKDSVNSLIASGVEIALFNGIKTLLIKPIHNLGVNVLAGLFGFKDDEEVNWQFEMKKFYSATLKDIIPYTILPMSEDWSLELANFVHYMGSDHKNKSLQEWQQYMIKKKKGLPFYRYGDKAGFDVIPMDNLGVYQAFVDMMKGEAGIFRSAELAFSDDPMVKNRYTGKPQKIRLSKKERRFEKLVFAADLLSTFRAIDADLLRIIKQVERKHVK